MSGLCLAIRLRQSGIDDIVIIEKSDEVGGTWLENDYPNSGCDVPSMLYSFSFAPYYDWTWKYARQPEILQYFRDVADRFDVRQHICFGQCVTDARYDESAKHWHVTLDDGSERTTDYFVSAVGQLNRPRIPKIDGAESFEGKTWHSARWDFQSDLTGKNVAIIGNGASTIQFIPGTAEKAGRLYLFQRSASWIHPLHNYRYPGWAKWCFHHLPLAAKLHRLWIFLMCEWRIIAFRENSLANRIYRWWLTRKMKSLIRPEMQDQLIPKYAPGCKRILLSADYLQTVQRPNVTLVTDDVTRFEPNALCAGDQAYPVDVVIYGTGFEATGLLQPMTISGRGGVRLQDAWSGHPQTLYGLATPGFPNFFMLYGPNTNLGHNSIIYMVEAQVNYILQCINEAEKRGTPELEVREDAVRAYDSEVQRSLGTTVWAGDCTSWYKTADGTIPNNWFASAYAYHKRTRTADFSAWSFQSADS
ncbi:MAG: NAD(P)/FAD-dependent oxidoreductase [Planctomycetaceae bacterium]|nr:NAD(P)/FAD-dependent oxidoreductase [Planctomycetaceae bacterium]